MDIKRYLEALPVMAALLLTGACSNEENAVVEEPQHAQARTIPFTATVTTGPQTRATIDGSNEYAFQKKDKLYIWGDKLYGELTLQGDGGSNYGTFKGTITLEEGCGDPKETNPELFAVIKSENDEILGTLSEFKNRNYLPNYALADTYASTFAEAVEKFSFFKTPFPGTYNDPSFSFYDSQNSAFVSFDITLEDGSTPAGADITAKISNNGSVEREATVTTVAEGGKVKAKFIAATRDGTTLNNANVTLGTGDIINFGGTKTLSGNTFYTVTKTYYGYRITASGTLSVTSPTPMSIPITKILPNQNIPMNTTLGDLLGDNANGITSFKAGGDETITFGAFDSSNPGATTVTISDTGTKVITIGGTVNYGGIDVTYQNSEITVSVIKYRVTP